MIKLDRSKITTNLGKKYKLVPYLDKALSGFDEPWEFKYEEKQPDDAWHPSGHCTLPLTDLYAIATEPVEREPFPVSTIKSFQVGHFWHQLLQYLVLHKLEFCSSEAIEKKGSHRWADEPFGWASGSGDIAPCEAPNWKGIVDFKTMASHQFRQNDLPAWIADKYECQINIYMDFFDEEEGIIIPINKDSPHDFKEFRFVRNQDLIDVIYERWEFVSDCVKNKTPITEMDNDFDPELPLTGPSS